MKRILFLFTTVSLMTFTSSCDSKGKFKWPWVEEAKPEFEELHSMVLIDLSKSRDTTSIHSALNKMEQIFFGQPTDVATYFIVKVVDSDESVSPLFNYSAMALAGRGSRDKETYNKTREQSAKEMRKNILWYYQNLGSHKKSSRQSCICNSLQNTNSYFEQIDLTKCKTQLFVFSDMFEECDKESSYFNEDFSTCNGENGRRKSMEKLLEIVQAHTPKHSLKAYVKAKNLYFITDENDQYNESQNNCLNHQDIETLWEKIFQKMGYSEKESKKIIIASIVPNHLITTQN